MLEYLVRRLLWAAVLFVGVTMITYVLFFLLPADPARLAAGKSATAEDVARVEQQLGLDRPVHEQYALFLKRLVVDQSLGRSYANRRSVNEMVGEAVPVTVALVFGGAILWMLIALPIGILSALRPRSLLDRATMIFVLVGISAPVVWIGLLLQYFVGFKWGLTPNAGYCDVISPPEGASCGGPADWAYHMILPWLTFAILFAASYARMIRSNVMDTMGEDYVRTARAKGAPENLVIRRARAPERAPADRDDARARHRRRARRGDLHGGDLQPPGSRSAGAEQRAQPRPADDAGRDRVRDARDHRHQPRRRHRLRVHRSADQARVTVAVESLASEAEVRAAPLLEVRDLRTYFKTDDGVVKAVDGVSFAVRPGETLGVVGESGSGKSVTMMSILNLNPKSGRLTPRPGTSPGEQMESFLRETKKHTSISTGEARFRGEDLLLASKRRLRALRGSEISMIFQDPMTSLNPCQQRFSSTPAQEPERAVKAPLSPEAKRVAMRFIQTAVARENLDEAWTLVGPNLRGGMTKASWTTGANPVVPYPIDKLEVAPYKVDESYATSALLEIALLPRKGAGIRAQVFFLELRKLGTGAEARWVVDNWVPRASAVVPR